MTELYLMKRKKDINIALPEFVITCRPESYWKSYEIFSKTDIDNQAVRDFMGMEGSKESIVGRLTTYMNIQKSKLMATQQLLEALGVQ